MYWSRPFPGDLASLAEIRELTFRVLGTGPGVEDVGLVALELAGNAIQHSESGGPGGSFRLHLAAFSNRWVVRVDDAGGPTEPQFDSESGQGLTLVAELSSAWRVAGDCNARTVWVEIMKPGESPK